jgi:hypothetical protein
MRPFTDRAFRNCFAKRPGLGVFPPVMLMEDLLRERIFHIYQRLRTITDTLSLNSGHSLVGRKVKSHLVAVISNVGQILVAIERSI